MRALASVQTVESLHPIVDADRIERARVRGWDVVVKVGEFMPGQRSVYFEIDSLLPESDRRFEFLAPRGVKELPDGTRGYVLRTAKLRGVTSQGLVLPLHLFPEIDQAASVGTDVTDALGVRKWEPPIPAELSGVMRGPWPGWLSKTDEERIQNHAELLAFAANEKWLAFEKIDGSSMSAFFDDDGNFHVASRNIDLVENPSNTMWSTARTLNLEALLAEYGLDAAQGELYGQNIQSNRLGVTGHHFAVFDLWRNKARIPREEWPEWARTMSVPRYPLVETTDALQSTDAIVAAVNGMRSVISPDRLAEGVVFRHPTATQVTLPDGRNVKASFKVISNKYLLKYED